MDESLRAYYEPIAREMLSRSISWLPEPEPPTRAQRIQRRLQDFQHALRPHEWDRYDYWDDYPTPA